LADVRNIWDKIQTKIIALNDLARYAYHISVSVGFTFFDDSDPQTSAELIAVADTNMYQGKMETRRDTNGR
jgi:GGDEF domain-containing protein